MSYQLYMSNVTLDHFPASLSATYIMRHNILVKKRDEYNHTSSDFRERSITHNIWVVHIKNKAFFYHTWQGKMPKWLWVF